MALQNLHGIGFFYPPMAGISGGTLVAGETLDAAGEKVGWVLQADKAFTLDQISIFFGDVTTGDTLDFRVETVGADGLPTGTLWATNTNIAVAVANGDDNVWKTGTLTANATIAKGDVYAIVIVNGGGGGNLYINTFAYTFASAYPSVGRQYRPYRLFYSSSWAKNADGAMSPVLGVHESGGSYLNIHGLTAKTFTQMNFNSGSTPDERGLYFQVPFTCKVSGCWVRSDLFGDVTVKLYDSDGSTVLASIVVDKDQQGFSSNGTTGAMHLSFTQAAITLVPNTNYRLTIVPSITSPDCFLDVLTFESAAFLDGMEGGSQMHYTARTDGGSWTETTTQRPLMGLYITALDDGASAGGGLSRHPGLAGGLNG